MLLHVGAWRDMAEKDHWTVYLSRCPGDACVHAASGMVLRWHSTAEGSSPTPCIIYQQQEPRDRLLLASANTAAEHIHMTIHH